jgi:hypothetical protein
VQTIGENEVLHPRSTALPLEYAFAKSALTAAGVATVSAAARLPAAQLDTSAVAAASALGFIALGSAGAVVEVVAAAADVVVMDSAA